MDDDLRPAQQGDAPADAAGGPPDPDGAGDTPQPPQWQERDAWTALDDLDASPAPAPASEWPAGAEGLDRPGLFGFGSMRPARPSSRAAWTCRSRPGGSTWGRPEPPGGPPAAPARRSAPVLAAPTWPARSAAPRCASRSSTPTSST